ncbi:hypothetical protein B566_EDAN006328 [Ephemera danica]|nr:hypothetical protein B566_EDAN006328 [Ephemera danica]
MGDSIHMPDTAVVEDNGVETPQHNYNLRRSSSFHVIQHSHSFTQTSLVENLTPDILSGDAEFYFAWDPAGLLTFGGKDLEDSPILEATVDSKHIKHGLWKYKNALYYLHDPQMGMLCFFSVASVYSGWKEVAAKRAAVWNHVLQNPQQPGHVKCKYCQRIIKNRGNTTNIRNHLQTSHPRKFQEMNDMEKNDRRFQPKSSSSATTETATENNDFPAPSSEMGRTSSPKPGSSKGPDFTLDETAEISIENENSINSNSVQSSIKTFIDRSKPLPAKQQKKCVDAVGKFIACEMQPYSLVENAGFILLLTTFLPGFKMPSRKTLTDSIIPRLYNSVAASFRTMLLAASYFAITTDNWTSVAMQAYIAVTVHFIDDNWDLIGLCLCCKEMSIDHTADNLADVLIDIFDELGLSLTSIQKKLSGATTDNGTNILNAVQKVLKWNHVSCFGHTLNIGINKIMKITRVEKVIARIKHIQNSFAHSWLLRRELAKEQQSLGKPVLKIPSVCPTRWWSLLRLLEFIDSNHVCIYNLFSRDETRFRKHRSKCLKTHELATIRILIKFLRPFNTISDELSSEKTVTSSSIWPSRTPSEIAKDEVESYLRLACDESSDPLSWWRENYRSLPNLSKLAKKYLCIQGTSVPSERVFSCGGNVITDNRASLTSDHADQLIFLAKNKKYIYTRRRLAGIATLYACVPVRRPMVQADDDDILLVYLLLIPLSLPLKQPVCRSRALLWASMDEMHIERIKFFFPAKLDTPPQVCITEEVSAKWPS